MASEYLAPKGPDHAEVVEVHVRGAVARSDFGMILGGEGFPESVPGTDHGDFRPFELGESGGVPGGGRGVVGDGDEGVGHAGRARPGAHRAGRHGNLQILGPGRSGQETEQAEESICVIS